LRVSVNLKLSQLPTCSYAIQPARRCYMKRR